MTQRKDNILPHNGKWPKISDDVFIAPGAIVIGDVEIGAGSSIWFNTVDTRRRKPCASERG